MKRAVIAVALVLLLGGAAGSVWANDVEGTVKVIQTKERFMTLEDGTKLHWTETTNVTPEIATGSKVKATYEKAQDGRMVLTKIEVVK